MNKNRIINKVVGLTLTIGGFIMSLLYLFEDWNFISIHLPKMFLNFWLLPMWIGVIIYHYRPGLSKTVKIMMWSAIALFCISLPMLFLSNSPWLYHTGETAIVVSSLLAVIAWIKTYNEVQYLEEDEEEDEEEEYEKN